MMQINIDDSIFNVPTVAAALIGAFLGFIIGSFVLGDSAITGVDTLPHLFSTIL